MGQSVLKSHFVGENYFSPDGYFGLERSDGLTLPIEDPAMIGRFSADFRLRRTSEPGLSIVVPWCEADINEQAVISAVCRDYFYPLLAAKLEVVVATPSRETLINHETLVTVSQGVSEQLPSELLALLELAEWATEVRPNERLTINAPPPDRSLRWSAELLSEDHINKIRAALQNGARIALRVPLIVREKTKEPRESFFDVFLIADPRAERGQPVFVREGIIISDVRAPRSRGVLSLVVVENDALATLLGDSENPAHTQWQQDSSNFKGKYIYGPSYIQFVKKSVSEIIQIVTKDDGEIDKTLLRDLFYLPIEKETPSIEVTETEDEVEPLPPSKPAVFRVRKVKGGFSVSNAQQNGTLPRFFVARVAYDLRRGSPLRKYKSS